MKNRVVILGDSLAMPRPDEGVGYEDTYSYLIFKDISKWGWVGEVINRSKRANDTQYQAHFQNIADDILLLQPTHTIIHLGICDCAPRLFKKLEQKILNKIPMKIRDKIISFFSKRRKLVTKFRQITYVDIKSFEKNLLHIINNAKSVNSKIVLIGIKDTSKENIEKSYKFKEKIDSYNEIIKKIALANQIEIIDANTFSGGLLSGGIHIDKYMHKYLYEKIICSINNRDESIENI